MSRCCLGLGGNLGDVLQTFAQAVAGLQDRAGRILAVSDAFRTRPVGPSAGGAFLNATAVLETGLAPEPLLDHLQQIENELHRRRGLRWGPRTLYLDLLLYDDLVIHSARLSVPHPGCLYRRFVLDPLAEIAGDWRHPETGLSIGEMRQRLLRRPLPVALSGGSQGDRDRLTDEIRRRFPELQVSDRDTPPQHCGHGLVCWPGAKSGGRKERARDDVEPSCLINLNSPGADDKSIVFSVVQALVDVPVRVGGIPGI